MVVQTLRITIYSPDGSTWRTEEKVHPHWRDIEAAIRRLDQYCYPFIWLYRADHLEENDPYDFDVIGGNDLYALDGIAKGKSFTYVRPDGGAELIRVWRSDQGFETAARYVCQDIDTVLQATKYFCDYGTPDPRLTWEWGELPL
jgi:hypothetical protein